MTVAYFADRAPSIGARSYIHPSADVFGDVTIGEDCWVGPGARIRGDYGTITIGSCTSIEDNCVVHARPGEETRIGNLVTLGHGSVIHNATVDDYAIIGMGAVISDWAAIGRWSVVGEGAVVRQHQSVPAEHIAVGVPARILDKTIDDAYRVEWTHFKETYVDLAHRYPQSWLPVNKG